MVLTVSFKDFPEAAKIAGCKEVFLAAHGKKLSVTAADPQKSLLISCICDFPFEEAEADLKDAGFKVRNGRWSESGELTEFSQTAEAYVAAISYQSKDSMPGLWMDAFPSQPTPQIALRAMFDEFRANDEVGEVSYEEFIKLAKPNVVILSPGEISTFLRQKEEC